LIRMSFTPFTMLDLVLFSRVVYPVDNPSSLEIRGPEYQDSRAWLRRCFTSALLAGGLRSGRAEE
jgi:hypothetical protein